MFDIAYEAEAAISYALERREQLWKIIYSTDLTQPFACLTEMLELERLKRFFVYYSIMLGTHGGC